MEPPQRHYDQSVHKKQRHTAQRIFERLRDEEGFSGGYTIVREYVARAMLRSREMFVPLSHRPGGGFWSGGCLYRGQEGPLSLFLCGFAALGRLLRQGLSGRDGGSLLRWSCGGVRLFRRRAAIDLVRQHPARGGQGREGRRAPALANVRGTPEPLPVRRPLWQTGQG